MADDFHEVRFPTGISYKSIGGPSFSTDVIMLSSGYEKRNANWTYPLERWNLAYGIKTKTDIITARDFFYARKGRAFGFRFKNPDDFSTTGEELGEGDGSTTQFQLVKTYTSGGSTLTRKITKPVSGQVTVYLSSVEQSSEISIDTTTGIVTFDTAPASGEVVTADFQFDIPVRFDTDHFAITMTTLEARSVDLPIVELRI